ncbi:Druantia anti-phage system protein DruA [Variovorax sp. MHTC-1]|uniref:Druantia anti-phage system protein DruA n=1 Tax=Variovorax sp. MHTC-1 TaxID=2495593 RepID=UPI000F88D5AA|nr:Druantia anti-phage system protein DruA [Variovorax sp. MHTC-1]RST52635.1 DUF4338 domain-containing protein [Variovorax sp. MHTC-1]
MIQSKTAPSATKTPASSAKVIYLPQQVDAVARALRVSVLEACSKFEAATGNDDKDYLRALHIQAKLGQSGGTAQTAKALFEKYHSRFRNGSEIDPSKIKPVLKFVQRNHEWSDLFYATRSMWSMPYNKGYGRRLRFVIFDEYHEAVIGIIGLQSPPADLAARDRLWDYPDKEKLALVNCTLDAYAVGAIPPYSYLLGGKLCAGMVSSDTIRQAYWRQYAGKKTRMLDENIQQPLAAVTTTSAFGRSSQYNRLKYNGRLLAEPIGYTMGFGTIHLEHLYPALCSYLKMVDGFTDGGFGNGPKVRWQNICRALVRLGLPASLLQHGVKREVFLYRLVDQLDDGMAGKGFGAPISLPEADFAEFWRERWAVPRAQRFPEWNLGKDVDLLRQTLVSAIAAPPAGAV